MHDLLLAKEIINEVISIIKEKSLKDIKKIILEIGSLALSHDGFEEHLEDADLDNLQFNLQSMALNKGLIDIIFDIKKIRGDNWKIVEIEVK